MRVKLFPNFQFWVLIGCVMSWCYIISAAHQDIRPCWRFRVKNYCVKYRRSPLPSKTFHPNLLTLQDFQHIPNSDKLFMNASTPSELSVTRFYDSKLSETSRSDSIRGLLCLNCAVPSLPGKETSGEGHVDERSFVVWLVLEMLQS